MWRYFCAIVHLLMLGVSDHPGVSADPQPHEYTGGQYPSYYEHTHPYNATVSFFFTADPQFGWGSSYSGNEER